MATAIPPSSVPMSRGIILHSIQQAIVAKWGDEGTRAVAARLPPEVARETTGPDYLPIRWYPTAHIVAWHHALYEGPANRDERLFAEANAHSLDVSMGLVRRAFMRLLTPATLAEKLTELWSSFHTHGRFTFEDRTDASARLTLRDHPFVDDAISRRVVGTMARHMLARSRAVNVRETHELRAPGEMVIRVTWAT